MVLTRSNGRVSGKARRLSPGVGNPRQSQSLGKAPA
jgi:hypothetical protein